MKKVEEFKPVTIWAVTDEKDNIIILYESREAARHNRRLLAWGSEFAGVKVRRLVAEREGRA